MSLAETARARRPDYALVAAFVVLAIACGIGVGVSVGLGLRPTLLAAALLAPFLVGITLARPHITAVVYAMLVYANLLSVLVEYDGFPPLARFVGMGLLAAALGYRLIILRKGLVAEDMTWWLVAYGVVLAAGLLYARAPDLVVPDLIEYARNFLAYLVIINTLTTMARVRWALWALLAMGSVLALLTVIQTVTGNFDSNFGGLAQAKITGITETVTGIRPGGTVGDPNYYGQSLLIVLPLAMYLASRGERTAIRVGGVVLSLLLVGAVIFTYSRGDGVALGAVLVAAIIYKKPRPAFIVGGLLALALMMSILPAEYYARLTSLLNVFGGSSQSILAESSLRGRAGAATAAVAMFADHPFLGVGRNNYPLYELDYIQGTNLASKSTGIPPHDLYLEVASEMGVLGILAMGGILVLAVRSLIEARRRFIALGDSSQAELTTWVGIGLLGYMVTSLFLHGAYLYMFWLQISLITAIRQSSRHHKVEAVAAVEGAPGAALPRPVPWRRRGGATTAGAQRRVSGTGRIMLWLVGGALLDLFVIVLIGLAGEYAVRPSANLPPSGSSQGSASSVLAIPTPVTVIFTQTGHAVSGPFLTFWQSKGGVRLFGYPISESMQEVSAGGRVLTVQYFERARFEYHPEFENTAQAVQLGLLGSEVAHNLPPAAVLPPGLEGSQVTLVEGKPPVPPLFAAFWQSAGADIAGYPITPVLVETGPGESQLYVQYFERVRLEYHPEYADPAAQVQVSLLGVQVFRSKYTGK